MTSHQYPSDPRLHTGVAYRVSGIPTVDSANSAIPASTVNMANPLLSYWSRLYTRPTKPEIALEPVLASLGHPYRFQHILSPYICDFALPTLGIILEVDGASHASPEAQAKDAVRDAALAKRGWRTVRVSNEWALRATREQLSEVLGLKE